MGYVSAASMSSIRSKAQFLGSLNPQAWDALIPHTPSQFPFGNAQVELLVAGVVKDVAGKIADKAVAQQVMDLSKSMAGQAATAMAADWDPGDDICPPWRWPFPGPPPWLDVTVDPRPDPWTPIAAAEQIELAHILTHLAGLTTSKEANKVLKGAAVKVAAGAAKTMIDEFERCGTKPRKPFPPHR